MITGTYARSRPPAQPSAWWPRASFNITVGARMLGPDLSLLPDSAGSGARNFVTVFVTQL